MAADREDDGRAVAEGGRQSPFFPPRGDAAVALVILATCAALYAVTLTFANAPPSLARGMQPRVFPQLVIGLIALLAVIILVQAKAAATGPSRTDWRAVAVTILACLGCVLLFEHVGVLLTLVLFGAVLPLAWGERRYLSVAIYAIVFPLVVWGLFRGILGVHFPGPIQDLLSG
jgi:putative tricarboxylic transport membrane protein